MRRAHTVAQVRAAEADLIARLPEGALMQRAAAGLAVATAQRLGRVYAAPVVLLVGGGDNGADALWAGAMLARRGAQVSAVLAATPRSDALEAFRAAGGRVLEHVPAAGLVVDGLVGIGGRGPLRHADLAEQVRDREVVAVDLPSGVDADTGEVAGTAVRADLTVTFGTLKPGLLLARGHVGALCLVDLGLALPVAPVEALDDEAAGHLLPEAGAGDDKYTRGVVGVVAGSGQYPGAAVLAVGAAVAAGAGMVRYVGTSTQVGTRWPEAVTSPSLRTAGRVQAWVVGPGLGTDVAAVGAVEAVLAQDVPVLVDADALTIAAQHQDWLSDRTAPTLLTPHDREFARFGDEVGADRIASARALARHLGVHVLLKGDATVVVGPDGPARVNATGTPALATAGSGDVLAGATGALLAQGLGPLDAGSLGAYLHGRAGRAATARGASALLQAWPARLRP